MGTYRELSPCGSAKCRNGNMGKRAPLAKTIATGGSRVHPGKKKGAEEVRARRRGSGAMEHRILPPPDVLLL